MAQNFITIFVIFHQITMCKILFFKRYGSHSMLCYFTASEIMHNITGERTTVMAEIMVRDGK